MREVPQISSKSDDGGNMNNNTALDPRLAANRQKFTDTQKGMEPVYNAVLNEIASFVRTRNEELRQFILNTFAAFW